VAVPAPLACDGATTYDPATGSVLVKGSGVGASYWRRGHAALMQAETPGSVSEFSRAAPTVRAHGARGEPVRDGWLRFKVDDATYRKLAGPDLSAIVTVDQAGGESWVSSSSTDRDRPSRVGGPCPGRCTA
jgi:hypothetical protein